MFHRRIHGWFVNSQVHELDSLDDRVYAELFLTPGDDPWLGLLPADTYTGLDDNGVELGNSGASAG